MTQIAAKFSWNDLFFKYYDRQNKSIWSENDLSIVKLVIANNRKSLDNASQAQILIVLCVYLARIVSPFYEGRSR